jgi:P27 family predicted phage terminase small subunit
MKGRKQHLPPSGEPPSAATMSAPTDLDQMARAEWDRLISELADGGTLRRLDRSVLLLHCAAYSQWVAARVQVETTGGAVVKSPSGLPMLNPWAGVARRAFDELIRTAAELGLSPVSRARLAGKATGKTGAKPATAEQPNPYLYDDLLLFAPTTRIDGRPSSSVRRTTRRGRPGQRSRPQ